MSPTSQACPTASTSTSLTASFTSTAPSSISDDYELVEDDQELESCPQAYEPHDSPGECGTRSSRVLPSGRIGLKTQDQTSRGSNVPPFACINQCDLATLSQLHEATLQQFTVLACRAPAPVSSLDVKQALAELQGATRPAASKQLSVLESIAQSLEYTRSQIAVLEDYALEQDGNHRKSCLDCAGGLVLPRTMAGDNISELSDSSSHAPEYLGEYFRLAREVFVMQERICEYRLDCDEKLASSGRQPSATSTNELRSLTSDLEKAQHRLHLQRDVCLAQGLDPELYRHRRVSSRSGKDLHVLMWLGQDYHQSEDPAEF